MITNHKVAVTIRWIARILSLASTALLLLFFIGDRFDASRVAARDWIGLILFPIGVVVGFAFAWWKEWLGGSITTASVLAFYLIYGLLLNDRINQGWAFIAFAFPGVLFLLSAILLRMDNTRSDHAKAWS